MSRITHNFIVCDFCGGEIPAGNDHIHSVGGVLSSSGGDQAFANLDFCSSIHLGMYAAMLATVPLPSPLYAAPPGAGPTVYEVRPPKGLVGDTVVLVGTGLTTATQVSFDSTTTTDFNVQSDTHMTVVVPQPAVAPQRPTAITVVSPNGISTQPVLFIYNTPPPDPTPSPDPTPTPSSP